MSLSEDQRSQFKQYLLDGILEAKSLNRAPRAAWLVQYLMRRDPEFRMRQLGYLNFEAFVAAVGGFATFHDGYDVVAQVDDGRAPSEAVPSTTTARTTFFGEKIDPSVWRAAIRVDASPAMLDRELFGQGQIAVVTEPGEGPSDRYLAIPTVTSEQESEWLLTWAEQRGIPEEERAEIRAALGTGGQYGATMVLRNHGYEREFMLARVQRTKDRLRTWAREHGLAWAPPLVVPFQGAAQDQRQMGPTGSSQFRRVVRDVIERLSDDELRELRLPVGIVYDVMSHVKR